MRVRNIKTYFGNIMLEEKNTYLPLGL